MLTFDGHTKWFFNKFNRIHVCLFLMTLRQQYNKIYALITCNGFLVVLVKYLLEFLTTCYVLFGFVNGPFC